MVKDRIYIYIYTKIEAVFIENEECYSKVYLSADKKKVLILFITLKCRIY